VGAVRRTFKTKEGDIQLSNYWYYQFYHQGKRYFKSTGTSNKQLAIQKGEKWRLKVLQDLHGIGIKKYLFEEALLSWYENYKLKLTKKRKTTHKNIQDSYKEAVKRIIYLIDPSTEKPVFTGKYLEDITKSLLMHAVRLWRRSGLKDSSILRMLSVVSSVFTNAILEDMTNIKPAIDLVKGTLKKPEPRQRYLSEEEYDKLINCSAPHLKDIILFAVETGLRKEEFLSLRWDDVDFISNRIYVKTTKSGRDRSVPLSELGKKPLQNRYSNATVAVYVFCNSEGVRFKDIKTAFNNACRRAEIKDLQIHDLRKTFGSWRLQGIRGKKLSLLEVSKLLGHSSIDLTASTYAFLDEQNINL
jgi:integrase